MKPTLHSCLNRQITTRLVLFTLLMLGIGQTKGFAQVLFNYSNLTSGGGTPAANITATVLTRGIPDIVQALDCMADQGFGSHGWPTTNVFEVGTFNNNGHYVELTLDPDLGFGLKVTGFSARSRRENPSGTANDGPLSLRYGYSVNGPAGPWITVNPGNPQSSNVCASGGVNRVWPAWVTLNPSNTIVFRIYGLSSGSSRVGDLFLRDVIVNGEVCANSPSITLTDNSQQVCKGVTAASLAYTGADASTYSIDYNAAANTAGFVDVGLPVNLNLPTVPAGSIPLAVPAGAAPGVYNGTLTIYNSCGFSSSYPFTVEVWALPTAVLSGDQTICIGDDAMLSAVLTGASPWSITLSNGGGTFSLPANPFEVSPNSTTTYTVITLTDNNNCSAIPTGITGSAIVTVNPLPAASFTVTETSGILPNDGAICAGSEVVFTFDELAYPSGTEFTVTADVSPDVYGNHTIMLTGVVVGDDLHLTEGVDFMGTLSITNITITAEGAPACESTVSPITVTVNPLPDAIVTVSPSDICPGGQIIFNLSEGNYPNSSLFDILTLVTVSTGSGPALFEDVEEGDFAPWTEGFLGDFTGDISFGTMTVTETLTGCTSNSAGTSVNVYEHPIFGFTAETTSGGSNSVDNSDAPATITANFCAGDFLTLSGYTDNGNIGYEVSYTTTESSPGVSNITYNGNPIGASSFGPDYSSATAATALSFFGTTYGNYGLTSGTSGQIVQVFTPYLDVDNDNNYDAGTDCPGNPITLIYNIYAIPTVTVMAPATVVCNGDLVNVVFSGNYASDVTYTWSGGNTAMGMAANGTGDISFTATNTGISDLVANLMVTPSAHGCPGTPVNFSITVHPEPVFILIATVEDGDPKSANNDGGPFAVTLDFCAGQSFTYDAFSTIPNVCFIEEIVTGTTNVLYGMTPIPVPRAPQPLPASFFAGSPYGPYNLAPGETYGWFVETFTPFYDANGNCTYESEFDCLGEPITLTYKVYAAPDAAADPETICSGSSTALDVSNPNDIDGSTFNWTVASYGAVTGGAFSGTGLDFNSNLIDGPLVNTTNAAIVVTYTITPVGPAPNNCEGEPIEVSVTVNPAIAASITTEEDGDPSDNIICEGASVTFVFHETGNPGAEFTITADVTDENGGLNTVILTDVVDGDHLTWTENEEFNGTLTLSNIVVTIEDVTVCTATLQGFDIIVNPSAEPVISGPTCVHVGSTIELGADAGLTPPATFESGEWSATPNVTLTLPLDNETVLVTGYQPGPASIYYTVTDNAGCVTTAEYEISVLGPLTLTQSTEDSPVGCGDLVEVCVSVSNFCDINGLAFSVNWDETKFEFVSATPVNLPDAESSSSSPGSLDYIWLGEPTGLESGDNVLCYTLRAITNTGMDDVSISDPLASNSNQSLVEVLADEPLTIVIEPLSFVLGGNPVVCPSENTATLTYCGVVGNPNHYEITFENVPPFDIADGGTLVPDLMGCGSIIINIPTGLSHGHYPATIVISNDETGCESIVYEFDIIVDETAPEASLEPALVEVDCIDDVPAPDINIVTAEDNCPGDLTIVALPDVHNEGTGCCEDPLVITRTYRVTDAAGNTTDVTQTITVEDCEAPEISAYFELNPCYASEAEIEAYINDNIGQYLSDNCSTPSVFNVTIEPVSGCEYEVIIFVVDECNNLNGESNIYHTVIDDEAPVLTVGVIAHCYETIEDAIEAAIEATNYTEPCSEVTFNADPGNQGLDCFYEIVLTGTDNCGHSAWVTYRTRVDNTAPLITSPNINHPLNLTNLLAGECYQTEAEAGAAAEALTTAEDDCSDPEDIGFDYHIEYEPYSDCNATVVVEVTDECGNVTNVYFTGVRIDATDPFIPEPDFDNEQYIPEIACFQLSSEAEAYMADFVRGIAEDCTPSEDLEIDAVYSLVEDVDCESGIVTITVTDCAGNSSEAVYPVDIDPTDPLFDLLPPIEVVCLDNIPLADDEAFIQLIQEEYVYDACSDVSVEVLENVLPIGCGEENQGYRIYQVTDCAGNTATQTQIILLNDAEAPTWDDEGGSLNNPSILACSCDAEACIAVKLAFVPTVLDNGCDNIVPTLIESLSSDVVDGCTRTITRVWTAEDGCGNQIETNFVLIFSILDQEAPSFNPLCQFMPPLVLSTFDGADCPSEALVSLQVGQTISPLNTWTVAGIEIPNLSGCIEDNCAEEEDINITVESIVYDDDVEDSPCARLITLSFEISDACGNTNENLFVCQYLIIDNVAPTWVTMPNALNFTVQCSDAAGLAQLQNLAPVPTDVCDEDLSTPVKMPGAFVAGSCPQKGTYTNTWIVTDCSGNTAQVFTQVINVIDTKAPTWVTLPGALNTTVSCNNVGQLATAQAQAPTAVDCDPTLSPVKNGGNLVPGNCPGTGTITNTWTVTDDCNNTSLVYTQVITIVDNTAPTATIGTIATCYQSVAAAEAAAIAATTGADECSVSVTKTAVTTGNCAATIVVTVRDCSGNTATATYSTRIDGTGPNLTEGTILHCYASIPLAEAAAKAATTRVDNCPGGMSISASTSGLCPATITVTVTDGCGNSSSVVYGDNNFNICIGPSTALTITTPASNGSSTCENEANALGAWLANHGGAVASDVNATWTYPPVVFSAVNCMTHSKTASVTFTAMNACGYTATTTATFTVTDNTPPTANLIANTNLTCSIGIPVADVNNVLGEADNCGTPTVAWLATSDNMAAGCPLAPRIIIHQYTVTDGYCNSITINQMITVKDNVPPSFTAPANITINVNAGCVYNASVTATGDVTNEQDNCTPSGPGLQATYTDVVVAGPSGQNPKFIITRTWRLVDACGNSATPRTQTITVNDVTPPTITGCPVNNLHAGSTIVVGENTYNCAWIATGLLAPTLNDNCGSPTLTYSLNGFFVGAATGTGSVNGRIFQEGVTTVTYTVTDAVGNTATCSFTITVNCLTISGRIIWEHNGSGVKDATVKLSQGVVQLGSDLSDAAGNYDLNVPGAGLFRITPIKNIFRLNGVTSADATRILAHLGGAPLITNPYKKVCADVNRNGLISAQDASLITGSIAGNPLALATFNTFWRFTPTTYVMPVTAPNVVPGFPEFRDIVVGAVDFPGVDFFGMKIGDVDAVWADPQMTPNLAPLVWVVQDQTLVAGTEIELTFATSNFNDLAAYQFALDFDPMQLQFVGFQALGAIPMNLADNFGAYNANLGELRNVWSAGKGTTLADGTQVFRAKFKVLAGGQQLSDVLKLDNTAIPCQAYNEALVATEVKLVFTTSVGTDTPLNLSNLQLELMQNRPNPFADATTIGFILPEACEAHIRILDISGRVLANYDRNYTAGYHELDFRMENATSYGVLFCELVTPQGKRTIKMMTAK